MVEEAAPPRKRRNLGRSFKGCFECLEGRVKCDERRPVCGVCERKGRECVFPDSDNFVNMTSSAAGPVLPNKCRRILNTVAIQQIEAPNIESPSVEDSSETDNGGSSLTRRGLKKLSALESGRMNCLELPAFSRESIHLDPLASMSPQALYEDFVRYTSQRLLAIPSKDNPIPSILCRLSSYSEQFYNIMLAHSACHQALLFGFPDTPTTHALLGRCYADLSANAFDNNEHASLFGALLSLLESDRGSDKEWERCAKFTIDAFNARRDRQTRESLNNEPGSLLAARSLAFRLMGRSIAIWNMVRETPLEFLCKPEFWPEWREDGMDCVSGMPLNAIPFFSEVGELIHLSNSLGYNRSVALRAWKVHSSLSNNLLSDTEIFDESSALYNLYHLTFKVHLYRRVFKFPSSHVYVRTDISRMLHLLDTFIPENSPVQMRCLFILMALCCECSISDTYHRDSLRRRIAYMDTDGLALNRKVRMSLDRFWSSPYLLLEGIETQEKREMRSGRISN